MKLAIATSLIAGAAAFAPAKQSARTSIATNMAFEDELGAQPPLGTSVGNEQCHPDECPKDVRGKLAVSP